MTIEARREKERAKKARHRAKVKAAGKLCVGCVSRPRDLEGQLCSRCRAETKATRMPEVQHHVPELAIMLRRARRPDARCAITGLTLAQLQLIGQRLEVDRIDSARGYVPGNMQLLAARLNHSKHTYEAPSMWAIESIESAVRAAEDPTYVPEAF